MDTKFYWTEKEERAKKAAQHVELISRVNKKEILEGIAQTEVYTGSVPVTYSSTTHIPHIYVDGLDSVGSMFAHQESGKKMAVLNFASYKNPGGMYLEGSKAQEECLMHSSDCYSCLKQFDDSFYAYNRQNLNRALYRNRGLYTPNVLFYDRETLTEQDIAEANVVCADVITVAAPNASAAFKYGKVLPQENKNALDSRIRFVLDIAEANQVKILILGAYGAGVFGQDAAVVAEIFKKYLESGKYSFEKVYFSVLNVGNGKNYEKMKNVLCNK